MAASAETCCGRRWAGLCVGKALQMYSNGPMLLELLGCRHSCGAVARAELLEAARLPHHEAVSNPLHTCRAASRLTRERIWSRRVISVWKRSALQLAAATASRVCIPDAIDATPTRHSTRRRRRFRKMLLERHLATHAQISLSWAYYANQRHANPAPIGPQVDRRPFYNFSSREYGGHVAAGAETEERAGNNDAD